jgi:serine/threonine-protein kinase
VGLAMIELGLGNLDRALDWTEIAFAERRGWLAYLNVNPVFDPLRGHPRFNDLVRRMKL